MFKLGVESQVVVSLEVGDDLVGVDVFFLKFLMMTAALQRIAGFNISGHGFVELVGSE